MSYIANKNFGLEVALGNVSGYGKVNKFGVALDCDSATATDIWDGADGTLSTDVWVAPTTARAHNIASTDAADDGDPVGTGMRTIRIYGLTAWGTAEVSEDVTLNGTTAVATANSYVIIHRMKGLTFGSGGTNAGTITATAATDATITAAIQPGKGQTLMAIYGIADSQTIAISRLHTDALAGPSGALIDGTLLVKENADQADCGFITKLRWHFTDVTGSHLEFDPPLTFAGPCIVKVQVVSDSNGTVVASTFDAYVVTN